MNGFDVRESAGSGSASSVVWNSAMRFWVSKRMRLRPRIGYSRGDGGITELRVSRRVVCEQMGEEGQEAAIRT